VWLAFAGHYQPHRVLTGKSTHASSADRSGQLEARSVSISKVALLRRSLESVVVNVGPGPGSVKPCAGA
jgi:hypothetical protein